MVSEPKPGMSNGQRDSRFSIINAIREDVDADEVEACLRHLRTFFQNGPTTARQVWRQRGAAYDEAPTRGSPGRPPCRSRCPASAMANNTTWPSQGRRVVQPQYPWPRFSSGATCRAASFGRATSSPAVTTRWLAPSQRQDGEDGMADRVRRGSSMARPAVCAADKLSAGARLRLFTSQGQAPDFLRPGRLSPGQIHKRFRLWLRFARTIQASSSRKPPDGSGKPPDASRKIVSAR